MLARNVEKIGLISALVCVSACSKTSPKPAEVDAAPAPVSPKASGAPKDEPRPVVDLIYATKTLVAVSSKVKNPRDYPEHLIDNKQDTAWNGETGDLKGWIATRVPKDAHVDFITITTGFDKIAKDGTDLFTANHRIKKLAITRDGLKVKEHTLDTNERKPQKIEIDQDGGEFKVEVQETVPGTKAEWKELVVSEFHVMGKTPSFTRGIGERPRVFVGSFDAHDNEIDPPKKSMKGPFPDLATYCRTQRALVAPTLAQSMREYKQNFGMDTKLVPMCEEAKIKAGPMRAPFHELSSVSYETGWSTDRTLVVRTDAGWVDVPALALDHDSHYDPGCASIFRGAPLDGAIVAGDKTPVLLLRWSLTAALWLTSGGAYPDIVRVKLQACRLEAGEMKCDEPIDINETTAPREAKKLKWRRDAKYTITDDGHVKWLAPMSGPFTEEDPADTFGADAGQ